MKVDVAHVTDAAEPDARGLQAHVYEYDEFTFSDDATALLARSYTDEPQRAAFTARREGKRTHLLCESDLRHPLFIEAATWLRAAGKTELRWLDGKLGSYIETKDFA